MSCLKTLVIPNKVANVTPMLCLCLQVFNIFAVHLTNVLLILVVSGCGCVVVWLCGLVVVWSNGFVFVVMWLWSCGCGQVDVVKWLCHVVKWSCGQVGM